MLERDLLISARGPRTPHRPSSLLARCGLLALLCACLNPDISDEPPVSETSAALETPDAGNTDDDLPLAHEPTEAPSPREPSPRAVITR